MVFQNRERTFESTLDLTSLRCLQLPSSVCSYVVIGRNMKQWRASIDYTSTGEETAVELPTLTNPKSQLLYYYSTSVFVQGLQQFNNGGWSQRNNVWVFIDNVMFTISNTMKICGLGPKKTVFLNGIVQIYSVILWCLFIEEYLWSKVLIFNTDLLLLWHGLCNPP